MASIKKRTAADGPRYDVRYRDPSGKTRTKTFRRRADADKFCATTEADKLRGQWIDPDAGRLIFRQYATAWVAQRTTSNGRALAPRTVELYRHQLDRHLLPTFGDDELKGITSAAVRSWHSAMVRSGHQVSAAKCYRLLRSILATATEDDLIVKNPCTIKGAGIERSPERPTATADQVWGIADNIEERLRAFVLVGAFAGLRFSEIAGLQRRHVDLLHGTITVAHQLVTVNSATAEQLGIEATTLGRPKSDAGYRTLAIPEPLVPALEAHLAEHAEPGPDGFLFVGARGATMHRGVFTKKFRKACTAAGVPRSFHFHDLRHTHMTAAAASGASTKELMRRLGQSSPAAALRYQHATDSRDKAIAGAVGDALARPVPRDDADEPRDGRAIDLDSRRAAR